MPKAHIALLMIYGISYEIYREFICEFISQGATHLILRFSLGTGALDAPISLPLEETPLIREMSRSDRGFAVPARKRWIA